MTYQYSAAGTIGRGNMNINLTFKKTLLTVALTSAFASTNTFATNTQTKEADIETIAVTATRSSLNVEDALVSQVVITREDIALMQPKSVLDLLTRISGIDISVQGGKGQASSVFIRGANASHTLFLLDGVRISSATLGTTSTQTLSPELIERIEIVKGPRAALWGSDAIGGVIQIFTRKLQSGDVFAGVTAGTNDFQQYRAGFGISHGDGQTSFSVSHERSQGFDVLENVEADNDGYQYTSVGIKGEQEINNHLTLDWLVNADKGNDEFDNAWGGDRGAINNHVWLLRGTYQTSGNGYENSLTTAISQNRDAKTTFGKGLSKDDADIFETRRNQFSVVNNTAFESGSQISVGLDHYVEEVNTPTLYEKDQRDVTGLFLHGLHDVGRFTFEGAVRYDDVEFIDTEVTFNLGTAYRIDEISRVVINHGSGFKAPTFNDLFYPEDAFGVGNKTLKSESSKTSEIIFDSALGGINYSVSLFQSDIENLIAWQPNEEKNDIPGFEFQWTPKNISEVDTLGLEIDVNYQAFGGENQLAISYVDAEDTSTKKQLLRRSKEQFSYQFSKQFEQLNLAVQYQYHGKRNDSGGIQLSSYSLANITSTYTLTPKLSVEAKVTNLFDKKYQTANTYNTQGRAFYLGVSYQNF